MSVVAPTVGAMSYSPQTPGRTDRFDDLDHFDLDGLNARIRRLMSGPAAEGRAEEYRRLLWLWTERSRSDVVEAA